MKIISLQPAGLFSVNSYIIISDKGNAALIDAPKGAKIILNTISSCGAALKKILLTHGHCDHIESLDELVKETGAEVCIHSADKPKLNDDFLNLSDYFSDFMDSSAPHYNGEVTETEDEDVITLDELEFHVLHTPGHTSGSVCYLLGDTLFSGDTLFNASVGRTDMTDGSFIELVQSLKKLTDTDEDYKIFPGHGAKTTLAAEKKSNPYLKGGSYDDML